MATILSYRGRLVTERDDGRELRRSNERVGNPPRLSGIAFDSPRPLR